MSQQYEESVRRLRRSRKLHAVTENRLVELLARAFPDARAVPEVSAIPGGRNDLLHYFFDGRRVVFEIFCSANQVPQDLRLLEQCDAAVKIAVLIDPEVDSSVSTQYFRKKPNAFPFLWLRHVLSANWEPITVARLRELIDENHSVAQLRRLLAGPGADFVDETMRKILEQVESKLPTSTSSTPPQLTGKEVLSLRILGLIKNMGVPVERLRSLFHWLVESTEYAIEVICCGLQAFLITDLDGRHAIWSSGDLVDDLIVFPPETASANVVVYLNPIFNEFFTRTGQTKVELKLHLFHTFEEFLERLPDGTLVVSRATPTGETTEQDDI